MKYKIGDKVRIKTWEQMEGEYPKDKWHYGFSAGDYLFISRMEDFLQCILFDRVVTIATVSAGRYEIEEDRGYIQSEGWHWTDEMIECSLEEYNSKKLDEYKIRPVVSRFDLMDFDD